MVFHQVSFANHILLIVALLIIQFRELIYFLSWTALLPFILVHHDKWCWNIDKRSRDSDGASMSLNPMGEFAMLHHEEDPVDRDFHDFRKKHKRDYKDKIEHQQRKHIFRHNLRWMNLIIQVSFWIRGKSRGRGCGAGHGRGAVEYFLGELHGFQGRTVWRSVVTNRV